MVNVHVPHQGEIWSYIPTIAGREKPSSLGADRVLVIQRSEVNALLPTVLAIPLESAPRMPTLAVPLSEDDPITGVSAIVYRITPLYRPWLVQRIGTVTELTLHRISEALAKLTRT